MKRPAVIALLFTILGIFLGRSAGIPLFYFAAAAGLCVCLYMRYRYAPVFLFALFMAAGMLRVWDRLNTGPLPLDEYITVKGYALETGTTRSGNTKLVADIKEAPLNTRIMVYAPGGADIETGMYIEIQGTLLPLETAQNPGDYDEFLALRSRKIDAKMFAASVNAAEPPDMGFDLRGAYIKLLAGLYRLKDKLASVYDGVLPGREAEIIKSIVLGDKAGLSDDIRELYKLAGVYHLLCVSGLHMSVLALALGGVLRLVISERAAGVAVLVFVALYCLLTGAPVSVVRAGVMCAVFTLSRLLFRDYDLAASASFACIVLLLYEPLYLYDAGFQLSFGAVFGIAGLTAPFERVLTFIKPPGKIKTALAANLAATTATAPLLAYHFYYLPAYAVLVNAVVLPTASLLVVAGLCVGLAGLLSFTAAAFMAGAVYYLLRFYDFVCRFFTGLPFAALETGNIGLLGCVAAAGVMAAFYYAFTAYGVVFKKRVIIFTAALLGFVIYVASCTGIAGG